MTNLTRVDFSPHIRSHHPKSIIYWVTEGITIDKIKYSIKEFILKDSGLYAIVTPDDRKYYEAFLTKSDTSEIEKQVDEINKKIKAIQNYDDSNLKSRIESLESKEDKDTTYRPGTGIQFVENNIIGIDDTVALKSDINSLNQSILTIEESIEDNKITIGDGLTKINNSVKVDFAVVPTRELVDELDNRVHTLENKPDNDTKYLAGNGLTLDDKTFNVDMTKLVSKETVDDINRRLSAQESKVDNDTIYSSGKGVTVNVNKTLDVNLDWLTETFKTNNEDLIKTTRVGQSIYLDLKGIKSYIDSTRETVRINYVPSSNKYLPNSVTNNSYNYQLTSTPRTNKELYATLILSFPEIRVTGVKNIDNVITSYTSTITNQKVKIQLFSDNASITSFFEKFRIVNADVEFEISGRVDISGTLLSISNVELMLVMGKALNSVKYKSVTGFMTNPFVVTEQIDGKEYRVESTRSCGVDLWVNSIKEK